MAEANLEDPRSGKPGKVMNIPYEIPMESPWNPTLAP